MDYNNLVYGFCVILAVTISVITLMNSKNWKLKVVVGLFVGILFTQASFCVYNGVWGSHNKFHHFKILTLAPARDL